MTDTDRESTDSKPKRDAQGRWLPGRSGNPGGKLGGRPRGSSMLAEIERQLAEEGPDGRTRQERIVAKLIAKAEKGDVRAMDILLRRVAPEKLAISGDGAGVVLMLRTFVGGDDDGQLLHDGPGSQWDRHEDPKPAAALPAEGPTVDAESAPAESPEGDEPPRERLVFEDV